jgi:glycosyltransferase involved in cell wall biosynthesis
MRNKPPARKFAPLADRGPLRVMFLNTSMPVGGAETLEVNLIRRLDRDRFSPEVCCLKEFGPLGEMLAQEVPGHEHLLRGKFDLRVLPRLTRLLKQRRIDAVVTVGAGDKMFWGRLAAWRAGVPVVLSALHSTGWPDGVGRLNRRLTRITDAFIGVADSHGIHLVEREGFPIDKVCVIPNGVDVDRFAIGDADDTVRRELKLERDAPVVGIVAALRPEKNHELFLRVASRVLKEIPAARFIIVGDGDLRSHLADYARDLGLNDVVRFLGNRNDVPQVLAALNVFLLTSRMEANPVSILEAFSAGKPVVAPRVGSLAESVAEGVSGYLTNPGDADEAAKRVVELLGDPSRARAMGEAGRQTVRDHWSLQRMVHGYEDLIVEVYERKSSRDHSLVPQAAACRERPAKAG